jgi:thiol-disulfide isomerase/thioredoxin
MKHLFKYALIFSYAIAALACSHSTAPTGKARLTGKFSGSFPVEQTFIIKVAAPNLVLGALKQFDEYEIQLETDGSFSLSIPLFSSVYALLSVNDNDEDYGAVFLSPDKETKLALSLNEANEVQIKLIEGQGLTPEDMDMINSPAMAFHQKLDDPNTYNGLRFDMSPEEYRDYFLNWTETQLSTILDGDESLPENLRQLLHKQLKYVFINYLFEYEDEVRSLYENQQTGKEIDEPIFTPAKPDKTYYSFLRFFDLKNPPLINTPSYPGIFQHILTDSILNIPPIDRQPLAEWLKEVKTVMTELVGSDTGSFYDMLTLHAYLKQLNEDFKPLSDNQKEDIKIYFKNPTFSNFLFTENDATIKQLKLPSTVKETPAVEKEKLMEAIISSYKGKVVLVDFWATWCGPCLEAMKESHELKVEMVNKGVVFVYLAEESSPKKLWEKKIPGIDGEHYYLTEEEWEYIATKLQFGAIPTYAFYNRNGELKNKIIGFPGVEEMRKMIENLL